MFPNSLLKSISAFLNQQKEMRLIPTNQRQFILQGDFIFKCTCEGENVIEGKYNLSIFVPFNFPKNIPVVEELENKIPRDGEHHVNYDGTLCLGTPFTLSNILYKKPTFENYIENCLIPFFYAIGYEEIQGTKFLFGETPHARNGILYDYAQSLDFTDINEQNIIYSIHLLSLKKRVANRKFCPCGCNKILRKCNFRFKLNQYRHIPRSWYSKEYKILIKK